MEYLYCFEDSHLTVRLMHYLEQKPQLPLHFVTVIVQQDEWIIKLKMKRSLESKENGDLRALLNELGCSIVPENSVQYAFWDLEMGRTIDAVSQRYNIFVVSHGRPNQVAVKNSGSP